MLGNGRIFISHAYQDSSSCETLLSALRAWGVDYWYDAEHMHPGDPLYQRMQEALEARDVFIRICTGAAQRSYHVEMEASAFRGLQAAEYARDGSTRRIFINIILSTDYKLQPFDRASIFIDAVNDMEGKWITELHRALSAAGCTHEKPLIRSDDDGISDEAIALPLIRIPIYLLVDESTSAHGANGSRITQAMWTLCGLILSDSMSSMFSHICVISYANSAMQFEFVPVQQFRPPRLILYESPSDEENGRCLGAALYLLNESLDKDLIEPSFDEQHNVTAGDLDPVVYLFCAATPSDEWRSVVARLKQREVHRPQLVGVSILESADTHALREICDDIIVLPGTEIAH